MSACSYPQLDVHKGEHRDFVKRIQDVTARFDAGPEDAAGIVNRELLDFLKDWLNHHILMQDMHYKKYVEGNPRASAAAERYGTGLSDPNWKRPSGV